MTTRLTVLAPARPLPLTALRTRLGGLAPAGSPRAGEVVVVDDAGAPAVLLDADTTHAHLWLGGGRARRVELARLSRAEAPDPSMAEVAARARSFRDVQEGDRVTFRDHGRDGRGVVADRCRFGVVVARADGTMVGVGFTRVSREAAGG
ncbi:MAG: hypothetical protein IT374_11300 [Polyangiaceae bacterium]|nr:hypothetical protein [Polyangiaceae bacterium]